MPFERYVHRGIAVSGLLLSLAGSVAGSTEFGGPVTSSPGTGALAASDTAVNDTAANDTGTRDTGTRSQQTLPQPAHLEASEFVLANGMRWVVVPRPGSSSLAAGWVVRSGSVDDPDGMAGAAHLLEHLLFKGSDRIGTSGDVEQEQEWMAELDRIEETVAENTVASSTRASESQPSTDPHRIADLQARSEALQKKLRSVRHLGEFSLLYSEQGAVGLNARTFEDFTSYFVNLPPQAIELWFWLESERLQRPILRELDKEKQVVEQERQQQRSASPTDRWSEQLRRELYPHHRYGLPILGFENSVEKISHRALVQHLQGRYTPERITAVLVGPIAIDRVKALAKKYFDRPNTAPSLSDSNGETAEDRSVIAPVSPASPIVTAPSGQHRFAIEARQQLAFYYPGASFGSPSAVAAELLIALLNGRSGRLHTQMVLERPIAFSAYAQQRPLRRAGTFSAHLEPRPGVDSPTALAAWRRELERLVAEPPSAAELERVRNGLLSESYRRLADPDALLQQLLNYEGLGIGWSWINHWSEKITAATATDAVAEARRLLETAPMIVSYGPKEPPPASVSAQKLPKVPPKVARVDPATISAGTASPDASSEGGRKRADTASKPKHPSELDLPPLRWQAPAPGERFDIGDASLHVVEDRSFPHVTVVAVSPSGGFLDPIDRTGLGFLTAAMMRRGGAGPLSAEAFDRRADQHAVELDVSGGGERFVAVMSAPSWSLDVGLELFFAMLLEPRFEAERVAAVRANVASQLATGPSSFAETARLGWYREVYGDEYYLGRQTTADTFGTFTRADLETYHQRYLQLHQMRFAISGDLATADLHGRFRRTLERMSPDRRPEPAPQVCSPEGLSNKKGLPGVHRLPFSPTSSDETVAVVAGAVLAPHPPWLSIEHVGLDLLGEIFGGTGAISRLQGRLRTAEGVTYATELVLEPDLCGRTELRISFDTTAANLDRSLLALRQEIERLRTELVDPYELKTVRTTVLSRLRLAFDTAEERAGYAAEDALLQRPEQFWQTYSERLEKVDAEAIRELARRYLEPDELTIVVSTSPTNSEQIGRATEIAGWPVARQPLER